MSDDLKVTYKDDGKQKWQSMEAHIDLPFDIWGYGVDKQEAKEELLEKLNLLITALQKIKCEME